MSLEHADLDDLNEVFQAFYKNKTWFPHIRKDYLRRQIERDSCVFHDGVIITYNEYQRKQKIGTCEAKRGDIILHQILNSKEGSGKAGVVLEQFFKMVNKPVWLTVRAENERAIQFYIKHGMKCVGETSWLRGTMKGLVFLKQV